MNYQQFDTVVRYQYLNLYCWPTLCRYNLYFYHKTNFISLSFFKNTNDYYYLYDRNNLNLSV